MLFPPICSRFACLLGLSLTLLFAGCSRMSLHQFTAAGHDIEARVSGPPEIAAFPHQAVIGSRFGTVTIESERMRMEALDWVVIAPDSAVSITITPNTLEVHAGKVTIRRTQS